MILVKSLKCQKSRHQNNVCKISKNFISNCIMLKIQSHEGKHSTVFANPAIIVFDGLGV